MIFSMTAIFALLFAASAVAWLGISIPHLIGPAASVAQWCRGIFELCLSSSSPLTSVLLWGGTAVLGGGLLYALIKGGISLFKSYRAIRKLPLADRGLSVALIRDGSVKVAFTHGLIRPKIYMSTGLLDSLTAEEARRVLLHEIHHKKNRDPLRFFLVTLLKDAFFYLPVGGYITRRLHAVKERAADDAVIERTGDPFVFAETLLKVARFGADMRIDVARTASIMGSGSLESRIKRLVDGKETREERPRLTVILTSVILAAALLFSASLPLLASTHDAETCDMKQCTTHLESGVYSKGDHCAKKTMGR